MHQLKPYYLLWGYRKCGTSSLANIMSASGIRMPDWDESNIWISQSEDIPEHLEKIWGGKWENQYLVDLSTLTHLGERDPASFLEPFGFYPVYLVCTRAPGPRWISGFMHMQIGKKDKRSLRDYINFYEPFIGLSQKDLRELEEDLIIRDLSSGTKTPAGLLGRNYFKDSYPAPFKCASIDTLYQYRYWGETIDMLEKRPPKYVELPLSSPEIIKQWLLKTFKIKELTGMEKISNSSGIFKRLRFHPGTKIMTHRVPRSIKRPIAGWLENQKIFQPGSKRAQTSGEKKEMFQLVNEMLRLGIDK